MVKSRPAGRNMSADGKNNLNILHGANKPIFHSPRPKKSIAELLAEAAELFEQGQAEAALPIADRAVTRLESAQDTEEISLPTALMLLGQICLEAGDVDLARTHFKRALELDPDGAEVAADALLYLAQLSEEGGSESIRFYEIANSILRRQIEELDDEDVMLTVEGKQLQEMKRDKLCESLCSMAEVYMTDLSWESDAEDKCETLVTEALAIAPESPTALQTLASIRISQLKQLDARSALSRSLDIWKNLPPDDIKVPDFPARVSLARLLMEVEMEHEAFEVLERLVREDEQSVEAWYLGGWCQVLLDKKTAGEDSEVKMGALQWLSNSLRIYDLVEYEDDKLHEHAEELTHDLKTELGIEIWEDESDEEDGDDDDVVETPDGDGQDEDVEIPDRNGHDEDIDMT